MDPTKVLALVLARGNGTRLHPLTAEQAKPALPFAGGYRIVDFVLGNLANSGISSIYVLAQYKPRSLIEHIRAAWAPWRDGERFIKVVLPETNGQAESFKGTSDAVYQNLHLIERHRPDLVAVLAADHVYRMDVRQMVSVHQQNGAEISIAAVPVPDRRRNPVRDYCHSPGWPRRRMPGKARASGAVSGRSKPRSGSFSIHCHASAALRLRRSRESAHIKWADGTA